jgi:serine/threonine protein phosphatase Stp1
MIWTSWAVTDVGTVRSNNEDSLVDLPAARLWAVADGAGGHQHGEVASQALKAALEAPFETSGADLVTEVRSRVAAVHDQLRERAESMGDHTTIASTLVVLLADGAHFACLWCGDSRAYLLRGGELSALSKDHSLVQELVDAGLLAEADAERHPHANVLTRAIGAEGPAPELDKITGRAEAGDRFLLCSDGLFKALDAATIARLTGGPEPARALIAAALAAAARDNVTAVVAEPSPGEEGDGTVLVRA